MGLSLLPPPWRAEYRVPRLEWRDKRLATYCTRKAKLEIAFPRIERDSPVGILRNVHRKARAFRCKALIRF